MSRRRRRGWARCPWTALAVAALPILVPIAIQAEEATRPFPDGMFYQANGTGFVLSVDDEADTLRTPIGVLTTFFGGDSIVVLTGTVSVLDFRTGSRSVFGEGTRYRIPWIGISPRSGWEVTRERLTELFRGPEPEGPEEVAVRENDLIVWPDSTAEFAPDVPIDFQWWDAPTSPSAIRIESGEWRADLPITAESLETGRLTWRDGEKPSGIVDWSLLDSDGEPLLTSKLRILTPEQAEEKRAGYRSRSRGEAIPLELEAVLRALADRSFLW